MNWIEALQKAVSLMEADLLNEISVQNIADACGFCPGHLQKGFSMVTGYAFAEYIRNRRLYLAAREMQETDLKVIDAALKYGYESPDAFARAFRRFHGFAPSQLGEHSGDVRVFLPLQIQITVRGGYDMHCEIQNIPAFDVIGTVSRIPAGEDSYQVIPALWRDFMTGDGRLPQSDGDSSAAQQAVWENNIGEFGICRMTESGEEYMIAGKYRGGQVPAGYEVWKIPALTWAQFDCFGPVPEALQSVNRQVFTEWLPQNPDYAPDGEFSLEYYPMGSTAAPDYRCQIWIPVKRK